MVSFRKKIKHKDSTNRLHLIMAIVFLIVGGVLFQLANLQLIKYDLYVALASDQHQVYNELKSNRGRIFLMDSREQSKTGEIYPIAANKDFALIYAVPNNVSEAPKTAEQLYKILNEEQVIKEVDELLEEDENFKDKDTEPAADNSDENIKEFREIKRELEIKRRAEEIIANYENILSKKNDPYEPIMHKVSAEKLAALEALNLSGIDYIMENNRYYPDNNIGAHILGFVGYNNDVRSGQYGLEGFFNEELSGQPGSLWAERSAGGELIILNDREYNKPVNGSDIILTINHSIQYRICQRLNEFALRYGASGGSVIVMNPDSGAILAMCSWPDYDPNNYSEIKDINRFNNPAIFHQFEPGSIFKAITMAASLDQGGVEPSTTYMDYGSVMIEGWPKPIKNSDFETHGAHGRVSMVKVLEESLNTGAIFAMQRIGAKKFADYVADFGFGEKTGIELETEASGDIRNLLRGKIRPVEAATASFGQGITATPLQIITAYAAIANGGLLMKPYLVDEIIFPDGTTHKTQPRVLRRVISERTALLLSGMLVNVVDGGHAKRAAVSGYYIGGKTGTAQVADMEKGGYYESQTIHTFVGYGPVDNPKFVMLVKLDDPKSVRFAASSAAPLFGEFADFILKYYEVPKER